MRNTKAELWPHHDSAQGLSLEELVWFWPVPLWLVSSIRKMGDVKTLFWKTSGGPQECKKNKKFSELNSLSLTEPLGVEAFHLCWPSDTWYRSRHVLVLVLTVTLLKTVADNLSLLCVRAQPVWKCEVSAAVAVGPFLFSSRWVCLFLYFHLYPGFLLSGAFRFVKPSMPVMLEPSPGTLTNFSLC